VGDEDGERGVLVLSVPRHALGKHVGIKEVFMTDRDGSLEEEEIGGGEVGRTRCEVFVGDRRVEFDSLRPGHRT